jgi:hypothetical protein
MSSGNEADVTTCSICLQPFNIPKYLPCLHTFCQSCISTYIASFLERGEKTSIECPVCKVSVSAPEDQCTAEDWAQRLPLNSLLVGLMEKHKLHRPEKICMSCERLQVKSTATCICVECSDALCSNCEKSHKSNKSSSHHEILSISDISEDSQNIKIFKNNCFEHKNKEIELFCMDHDIPCCSTCVAVKHRKCEHVLTIDDAANNFVSSKETDKITNDLDNILHDINTFESHTRNCLSTLETMYKLEKKKAESFWENLSLKLKVTEEFQKINLLKLYQEQVCYIQSKSSEVQNHKKAVENDRRILGISIKEASDVQVLLESTKLQKQLENHKRLLKQMATTSCDCTLQFKISSNANTMFNMIDENIKISCDTSSCNIAFKSVVEDNNDTEDECNDSDAYNEVPVAEIEQCEITEFQPNNKPPIQRGYNGLPIQWGHTGPPTQRGHTGPPRQRGHTGPPIQQENTGPPIQQWYCGQEFYDEPYGSYVTSSEESDG